MKKILLIGTHNQAKFSEIQRTLAETPFKLLSLAESGVVTSVEETGTTLEENAVLKAQAYAKLTGYVTLADDCGLEVEALGGAPGVHASRWAGEDATDKQKIQFLLNAMHAIANEQRRARVSTVIAIARPSGETKIYRGFCDGFITREPQGFLVPGFPYCTVFLNPELGKTFAQLDQEGIVYATHRVKALQQFINDQNIY